MGRFVTQNTQSSIQTMIFNATQGAVKTILEISYVVVCFEYLFALGRFAQLKHSCPPFRMGMKRPMSQQSIG